MIQKYTADEARNLKAYGELPETAKINETDTFGPGEDDDNIEFDEEEIEYAYFAYISLLALTLPPPAISNLYKLCIPASYCWTVRVHPANLRILIKYNLAPYLAFSRLE